MAGLCRNAEPRLQCLQDGASLAAFDKLDQFKLFVFDTGLLKHMAGIDNSAILLKTDYQFKGPLTENYVLQQLRGQFEVEPRYYSDKNSEIDFLIQCGTEIIPVEAKGGEDKSHRRLRNISQTVTRYALRYSKRGYRKDGAITNLPLYLARKTKRAALTYQPLTANVRGLLVLCFFRNKCRLLLLIQYVSM